MAKTILITGCSSGIGYTVAHELKKLGWRVFASARKAEDVERLKSEGLEAFCLDLSDSDSISSCLNWLLNKTDGQLDALFNNGAFAVPGAVEDIKPMALFEQFDHGFFGWHELTKSVLEIMRKQGYGRIINNSSVLGIVAMPYRSAYVANKFAIEGWSDCLRLELKSENIHVSLIECGPIKTNFRANAFAMFKKYINREKSFHNKAYNVMTKRFESGKPEPFTLNPEDVMPSLIHALEAKKPKARYFVTKATWIMTILKRLLPTFLLDKFILFLGKREAKRY